MENHPRANNVNANINPYQPPDVSVWKDEPKVVPPLPQDPAIMNDMKIQSALGLALMGIWAVGIPNILSLLMMGISIDRNGCSAESIQHWNFALAINLVSLMVWMYVMSLML